ncbi:S1 RNA-binding domain-containing protein [Streptomyces sp. NPDC002835]
MRIEHLKRGQVLSGVVTRLEDYGAVIDLGHREGLIDNAHLSWIPGKMPHEVLCLGEVVKVVVVRVDEEADELTLSLRDLEPDPLLAFAVNFLDRTVVGSLDKVTPIGVFIQIEGGFLGLIPGDSEDILRRISDSLHSGGLVDVKVTSVNVFARKIELDISEGDPERP